MHFRETTQKILTSTESIIAHLDDHMVKTHTMRGSPYFKAFEGKINITLISYDLTLYDCTIFPQNLMGYLNIAYIF